MKLKKLLKELDELAKGVKTTPLLNIEHSERKGDATHAYINMGRFFKKILVREIAGILQWDATKDISQILDDAENKLNHHLKKKIGVNPSLTLPGNYARILLDPKHEQHFTELTDDKERKDSVVSFCEKNLSF